MRKVFFEGLILGNFGNFRNSWEMKKKAIRWGRAVHLLENITAVL